MSKGEKTKRSDERTEIKSCTCKHEFQDETYGKSMRVFNFVDSINPKGGWRCTVCTRTISN